ncbi:MAG: hypothetical protein HZA61_02325 [Candidatus Eisenbacteria bacterium]|uniref:Uncharacterized protein n=1 Tax=Eiseniibacteriota bacterium TaxID=2212470 RepID=A0A933SAN3_UNCEI|nr:hypothetical protein [Candidatus Eisenbacteria bacterium]
MKRILSVLFLAAVVALAITVVSTASQNPGKTTARTAAASHASNADCPPGCPPEHCDGAGQCPAMSGKASTTVHADMSGATCPYSGSGAGTGETGCPSECKPSGAATTVAMAEGKH